MNELEEIRRKKMEELKKKQAEVERAQEMMSQLRKDASLFLDNDAKNRMDNLRMINPVKAARAEAYIVQLARAKRVSREKKINDKSLKEILRKIEPPRREPKIRWLS